MVSQVDVLSDREKDILTNYDRFVLRKGDQHVFSFRFLGRPGLKQYFFCSRLYGFLRIQDPIGDSSLPDLTHKSLLLKVGAKFATFQFSARTS